MALSFRSKPSRFVRDSGTGNTLTSYLVCTTLSCDENSYKHDKQTRLDFRRSLVSGLPSPRRVRGRGAGSFPEQRLVIEPTNKQAVLKWERKQSISCTKVGFSSPELLMEDLPLFCGWRRNSRVQRLQFCNGFLLNCETASTARCPAVKNFLF